MIKRSTGAGAFALFAGMILVAALGGCSAAGAPSQFAPPATQQSAVAHRTASGAAKIAPGSIFVGYGAGAKSYIEIYGNESDKWAPIGVITYVVLNPASMRVDRNGKLYVADYGADAVPTYVDGQFAGSLTQSVAAPHGLAIDSESDLAVLNSTARGKGPRITFFPFGTDKYPCVVTKGLQDPRDIAYDGFNVWVADYGANALIQYSQCNPDVQHTITEGVNLPVAVLPDRYAGFLWAANAGGNNVSAYNYLGPIKTISTGDLQPTALAAHDEHLYIAAYGGLNGKSEVIDYNVKYGTKRAITDGVNAPKALAWCDPNLCVMNAFGITIYDSSDNLVNAIKTKQTPLSLTAMP
jgi:hypothetical protein